MIDFCNLKLICFQQISNSTAEQGQRNLLLKIKEGNLLKYQIRVAILFNWLPFYSALKKFSDYLKGPFKTWNFSTFLDKSVPIFLSFNFRSCYIPEAHFGLPQYRCITTKQNSYNLDVMRRGNENLIWKMNSYLLSVLFEQPLVEMLMETYWIWRRNCFNSKYTRLSIQFESFSLFLPSFLEY